MAGKTSLFGKLLKGTVKGIVNFLTIGGNYIGNKIAKSNNRKMLTAAAAVGAIAATAIPVFGPFISISLLSAAVKSTGIQVINSVTGKPQSQDIESNTPSNNPPKGNQKNQELEQQQNISHSQTQETQQTHEKPQEGMSTSTKIAIVAGLVVLTTISLPLGIMAAAGMGASYGYNKIQAANKNQKIGTGKKAAITIGLLALTTIISPPLGFAASMGVLVTHGYNKYKAGKQQSSSPTIEQDAQKSKPPTNPGKKTHTRQQSNAQKMNIGSLKPTPTPRKDTPSQGMGK